MAQKRARPGRRLIAFALLVAAMFGGVALGGQWQPKLGLDLQGGTRITLEASTTTGQEVTPENLAEARGIIDQRVNGSGVTEGTVATQGGRNIVVEIPGEKRGDLVDAVKATAQLRFRLVALVAAGQPEASPSASPSGSGSPSGAPTAGTSASPSAKQTAEPNDKATPRERALSRGLLAADRAATAPSAADPSATAPSAADPGQPAQGAASPSVDPSALASALPSSDAGAPPAPPTTAKGAAVGNPLAWVDNPGDAWIKRFSDFTCPADGDAPSVDDRADRPLVTCGAQGEKYLLSAAMIEGTQLKSANAQPPDQQNIEWTVNLTFNAAARETFSTVTQAIANQTSGLTQQQKQFAIVLDGRVISAPTVNEPILNGQAQISGSFTQTSSQNLANSLKYGALPLKFDVPVVSEQGPTLAADQLSAGLVAGGIGLALVMGYCLLYYRGLGLVVIASLGVAALLTYAVVLAMSQAVSFTLTLPGIAGLIVAVGITADSFIVYFERMRDEMRAGKSMRVAVETGWTRARATCLAADAVSLLAAVVLYIFSIGVVKGFAFALGISTLIDLAVFFWFTHPMVSWLATFRFFYSGHRFSGLSPDQVGTSRRTTTARPVPAGGNA